MNRFLLPAGMMLAALVAFDSVYDHRLRLAELERTEVCRPEQLAQLRASFMREQTDWRKAAEDRRVEEREELLAVARADRERIEHLEGRLAEQRTRLEQQQAEFADLQEEWNDLTPEELRRRLFELQARIEAQKADFQLAAQQDQESWSGVHRDLRTLEKRLERSLAGEDSEQLWSDLVGPVVQLLGETTVGSGVLLRSRAQEGGGFSTHVLTAWHVVRDILAKPDELSAPVAVKLYSPDGTWRNLEARIVARDAALDLALLVVDSREALPFGAELATRSELEALRTFDVVYAVGCPLGNDPIPTMGEIASTHHEVDGASYWMISAPTYIGNSGGGIYAARSHRLVGIFSKIYTHGSSRTTIVPHMGLATPLSVVYDWLDTTSYAYLEGGSTQSEPQSAAMQVR